MRSRAVGTGEGFNFNVDQLFGYTTRRDGKLALIVVVREKGLTAIVKKVRKALEMHEQFAEFCEVDLETKSEPFNEMAGR